MQKLQYKDFSCGNEKDENRKYDQNCRKFEGGQNESAQGLRLRNTQLTKMIRAINLTRVTKIAKLRSKPEEEGMSIYRFDK